MCIVWPACPLPLSLWDFFKPATLWAGLKKPRTGSRIECQDRGPWDTCTLYGLLHTLCPDRGPPRGGVGSGLRRVRRGLLFVSLWGGRRTPVHPLFLFLFFAPLEWCFCVGFVLFSSWVFGLFLSSFTCSNELNIIYKIHHCQQVLIYLGGEASLTALPSLLPVTCYTSHVSTVLILFTCLCNEI